MTLTEALVLGLAQGLTEFLPVSSSGHLVILQHVFGLNEPPITFDVLVHVGTLVAILVFFQEEIRKIDLKMGKTIILGLIPTALIGLFLSKFTDKLFGSLDLIGVAFLITSLFLLSTKFISKLKIEKKDEISGKAALIIGIIQGIAVIPGISRSGSTIISGFWLGLNKKTAITYSFLLSIPAIIGAQVLTLANHVNLNNIQIEIYLVGFLSAAITGWISLKLLKKTIQEQKLHLFAIYTFLLSLLVLFS